MFVELIYLRHKTYGEKKMDTERRNLLLQIIDEAERSVVSGNEISPEFARILFPPERKEYELTYYGKQNAQSVISNSFAAPIQLECSYARFTDRFFSAQ